MPMCFPTLTRIKSEDKWQSALKSPLFGDPKLCTSEEMKQVISDVRNWSKNSKTASAIFDDIDSKGVDIYIIGMKSGGYTCFDSDCPRTGSGTCYVDVEAIFSIKSTNDNLHNYIALLHELGHARQWIDNPGWFNLASQAEQNKSRPSAKDLQQRIVERAANQGKTSKPAIPVATASQGGPPPPPPPGGQGPSRLQIRKNISDTLQWQSIQGKHIKWPFVIEQDNMARHEWPICDEMHYPRRQGYADLSVQYKG